MAMWNDDMQLSNYKNDRRSTNQLLDAQAHIWNQTFSFINSMSLKCAIQLGIPHIIHAHGAPMSLSQLVDALPVNKAKSQCIHRLMRMLTHSNFFVITSNGEEDLYWLAPASHLLLRNAPMSAAPFALLFLDPVYTEPWLYMNEWLVDEKHGSPFEMVYGKTLWEHLGQDLRLRNLLDEAMSCDARLLMPILLKDYRHVFEGVELVVDVGGGIGTTAMAILDALPMGTKCIVLDLPHVVDGLEGTNNLTFVGGDMFESVPQGDAVLLKLVLHSLNDEDCVRILKKCKEAISGKTKTGVGKVVIIDMVLDKDGNNKVVEEAQLLCNMAVMTYTKGKERTEKEWAKLFTNAGFSSYKISRVLGLKSIIEAYP